MASTIDVVLHLVVVGMDPVGPGPRHGRVVTHHNIVEGLGPVRFEGNLDHARRVVEEVERVLPEDARLVVVPVPTCDWCVRHLSPNAQALVGGSRRGSRGGIPKRGRRTD